MDTVEVLRTVLDGWKAAVDDHDPERVASFFTEDALFQGLHPYSIGRPGISSYYAAQPIGMAADYDILETRQLADDIVVGYTRVDFTFIDRPALPVNLTTIVRRGANGWLIDHYQVSRVE
jgi:uncharacterized protein (TIGR02246 family)